MKVFLLGGSCPGDPGLPGWPHVPVSLQLAGTHPADPLTAICTELRAPLWGRGAGKERVQG